MQMASCVSLHYADFSQCSNAVDIIYSYCGQMLMLSSKWCVIAMGGRNERDAVRKSFLWWHLHRGAVRSPSCLPILTGPLDQSLSVIKCEDVDKGQLITCLLNPCSSRLFKKICMLWAYVKPVVMASLWEKMVLAMLKEAAMRLFKKKALKTWWPVNYRVSWKSWVF